MEEEWRRFDKPTYVLWRCAEIFDSSHEPPKCTSYRLISSPECTSYLLSKISFRLSSSSSPECTLYLLLKISFRLSSSCFASFFQSTTMSFCGSDTFPAINFSTPTPNRHGAFNVITSFSSPMEESYTLSQVDSACTLAFHGYPFADLSCSCQIPRNYHLHFKFSTRRLTISLCSPGMQHTIASFCETTV